MTTTNTGWTFLHVNDSHMGTPRSYRFRPAINQRWAAIKHQMAATKADLLLHGGDLTRDGDTHEFEYQQAQEDLETLPFPVFVIPGNMDVGNKHTDRNGEKRRWKGLEWHDPDWNMTQRRLDLFASYFGPIHWTFVHRNVRFTGIYAAVAGTGFPQELRMWRMLERIPQLPPTQHHVVVMHYWPFIEQLDEPAWDLTQGDQYDNWYFSIDPPYRQRLWRLLKAAQVQIVFCGHVHTGRPVQVVDGIRIYRTPAAGNTCQLSVGLVPDNQHIARITHDGCAQEIVRLASEAHGNGTRHRHRPYQGADVRLVICTSPFELNRDWLFIGFPDACPAS